MAPKKHLIRKIDSFLEKYKFERRFEGLRLNQTKLRKQIFDQPT